MPKPEQSPTPVVERRDDRRRYEILVDGERAGLTAYRDKEEQRVFYHTETAEAFAGRGLARELVRYALDDTRRQGKRIVPVCPYVAKFLERTDAYADITDEVTPEIRHWLKAELS
ncbi:GNAT family N-acetyltransferase [Streptomyces bauhiniae]|uniref:GNAT family N-acetyltransferase n=1 Tax=Streptomyces bauhiniae TaxID=2340725 RepID=UPI0035D7F3B1